MHFTSGLILVQSHEFVTDDVHTSQHSPVTDGLLRRMVHALSNQIPNLLTCIVEFGSPFQVGRRTFNISCYRLPAVMSQWERTAAWAVWTSAGERQMLRSRQTLHCSALPCRCRSLHFEWRTRTGHGILLSFFFCHGTESYLPL